jgi:hypothetical protein
VIACINHQDVIFHSVDRNACWAVELPLPGAQRAPLSQQHSIKIKTHDFMFAGIGHIHFIGHLVDRKAAHFSGKVRMGNTGKINAIGIEPANKFVTKPGWGIRINNAAIQGQIIAIGIRGDRRRD